MEIESCQYMYVNNFKEIERDTHTEKKNKNENLFNSQMMYEIMMRREICL